MAKKDKQKKRQQRIKQQKHRRKFGAVEEHTVIFLDNPRKHKDPTNPNLLCIEGYHGFNEEIWQKEQE
jgi:hypothetical protein